MPRAEVIERVNKDYNIHSAFAVVLSTVVEQVANFPITQLPVDARGANGEVEFEEALGFDRRGGFTLKNLIIKKQQQTSESSSGGKDATATTQQEVVINDKVLQIWLDRMQSLGGPKLLDRAAPIRRHDDSSSDDDDEEEDDGGDADDGLKTNKDEDNDAPDPNDPSAGPSFRSDRRIIRLLIARYWADQMMKKFLADQPDAPEPE